MRRLADLDAVDIHAARFERRLEVLQAVAQKLRSLFVARGERGCEAAIDHFDRDLERAEFGRIEPDMHLAAALERLRPHGRHHLIDVVLKKLLLGREVLRRRDAGRRGNVCFRLRSDVRL